ncbi:glycosyltransferase family 4 protein [Trichocoleus sp. FACHB-6]|uniref:glycosyltransferase family 4 protein n=1 Tax=unclassified Trichocoleus TaxID=2628910 RepID=UPI001689B662|nr:MULTISPECIES: glycosyltransferase family 4 protein [unclassified Trichocoleus]MBD1906876.1 glycosyltransferase family 4 protein [Trichocoleus sp. FACHB-832]MBD2060931.1 glycosyltransferase family 4 protein [Trichocoleus sp. FACHB-6]
MHLIVLENEPSSVRGGQELSLLDVCHGLSKRGHTITLLYLKEGNLIEQYREFSIDLVNIKSYILDRSTINYFFDFFADILKISANQNSVVYSNRYHDVFFGYVLSVFKKIPSVCHLRLPPPPGFGRPHTIGLKGTKQFITISQQTKLDWINSGVSADKIDVVYNAINTELFKVPENFYDLRIKWDIAEDVKVISYVGRLDKEKGIETLLKAFSLLLKSGYKLRLFIAGKPLSTEQEYQNSLEELVTNLGIKEHTSFLGHVNDTTSLYQVSDVTVLPSLWPEPFGRTIIESMACGTPVVASRTGGIPEILTGEFERGLFETGNERDLADKLLKIMHWRDSYPHLQQRCRTHVLCNFDRENMINSIEKVFMKVIKN